MSGYYERDSKISNIYRYSTSSSEIRDIENRGYTGETLEENEEGEEMSDQQCIKEYKPSPITGRMSGSMEELERMQGSEANSAEVRECLRDSLDCYQICTKTITACLTLGDKHSEVKHLNLLMDCAKICSTNADFILRNSTYYPQTCGLAADICDECADSCERFDDQFMKECASTCRRCSESCREMAR